MPWKRSTYIAFTPVVENAQTHLKLKGLELKARKKQQKGKGRKLISSNTHGSLTEKLHSVTKQACGGWYTVKGNRSSAFCAVFITPKTIICELERRNSSLANKYKVAHEVADKVTYNAFLSSYWLGKEEVANEKLLSLIELEKHVGVTEM
ncbi:unnamed protein product [Porites evermanni]|uniref:Uncharacterized protein n=1 Tax=Porites evermanni TaxID=104178 RepID=A0ABN8LQI0_9CNID|nr:unnamed protein product [Porites evermanni]